MRHLTRQAAATRSSSPRQPGWRVARPSMWWPSGIDSHQPRGQHDNLETGPGVRWMFSGVAARVPRPAQPAGMRTSRGIHMWRSHTVAPGIPGRRSLRSRPARRVLGGVSCASRGDSCAIQSRGAGSASVGCSRHVLQSLQARRASAASAGTPDLVVHNRTLDRNPFSVEATRERRSTVLTASTANGRPVLSGNRCADLPGSGRTRSRARPCRVAR